MTTIADGPALAFKPGTKKQPAVAPEDPRVPQLRAKLGISENPDDTKYDEKVANAVRKFQENADLKPTGVLDDKTVKAINSPKRDRTIDTVLVNMERWRWLPRHLGAPRDQGRLCDPQHPRLHPEMMQGGAQVWTTRVVTGKPGNHATPMLTETMKFITVNPTWNVPPVDHLQRISAGSAAGPTVLQRMGLRLERKRDGSIHISQPRAKPTRSAASASTSRTSSSLSTRHPGQAPVRQGRARLQPWLHARQFPDHYAATLLNITMPGGGYTPEEDPRHVRPLRDRPEIPDPDSRSTSPTRPRSWMTAASCRYARTSMAATPR